jgi:RNA polymerase sigma factor (TIGR02999 family)
VDSTLSTLLTAAEQGDRAAADTLLAALYKELHAMAQLELARRGAGATLGPTTLLHETYLDISRRVRAVFPDRRSFMVYASRVMRGLIIDSVRSRQSQKRGGDFEFVSLTGDIADEIPDRTALTFVRDAMDALATVDSRLALIVDLKFFCGFSLIEIAGMQGVSERTVQRDWEKARIYLRLALQDSSPFA